MYVGEGHPANGTSNIKPGTRCSGYLHPCGTIANYLCICQQYYTKTTIIIKPKLEGGLKAGPRKNPFNLVADPDIFINFSGDIISGYLRPVLAF